MCETVMTAIKVKVIAASMRTYWYAGKIDEEFWVLKDDDNSGYKLVEHTAGRWIDFDDCEVIRAGNLRVITTIEEL